MQQTISFIYHLYRQEANISVEGGWQTWVNSVKCNPSSWICLCNYRNLLIMVVPPASAAFVPW